jgi:type VI secretion system lysozyme-like protein
MADSFLAPLMYRFRNLSRFCSADDVVESVRQNIECLLNARLSIPPDYTLRPTDKESIELLNNSLVNFGVVDFQSLNMGDPLMEKRFCKSVQLSIERFEPRLDKVKVSMSAATNERLINTEVTGELVVQPFEAIRFESGLDTGSQAFVVS